MPDTPNVLLLVVDSLRYDAALGDWETETPTFDRLAANGVTLHNCFSQGISTAPAMTAMLTGRLPLDYGGHWYLDADQPTFAAEFKRAGYTTGAIHSNPYVSSRRNFDRGFDRFTEDVVAFEPDRGLERAPEKLRRLASRAARILSRTPYTPADEVNDLVTGFVDDATSPWFCWTQYMDVHGPYLPGDDISYRSKFRAEWLWRKAAVRSPDEITESEHAELRDHYRQEVEYLDRAVGNLLDDLDRRGELDNTTVILTADHGDEFHEHGRYGHGNLPYDELTHVPAIIRFPDGVGPEPTEVDDLVRCVDLLPTVLDAVGADLSTAMRDRLAGESLLPLVEGEDREEPPTVVTEKRVRGEDALRIAFRTRDWKYLYDGTTDERLLYDLTADPGEQADVFDDEPEVADRFDDRLAERFDRIRETSENVDVPEFETDAEVDERLRALGYKD